MDIEQDLKILKNPGAMLCLQLIKKKIFTKICDLNVTVSESEEPLDFENRAAGYKEIKKGSIWGKAFSCAWFHLTGDIPEAYRNKKLAVVFDICAEALIYDGEGKPVAGISNPVNIASVAEALNPPSGKTFVFADKTEDGKIDLWADAGFNGVQGYEKGHGLLKKAYLAVFNPDAYKLYFDFLAVLFAYVNFEGRDKAASEKALRKAYFCFMKGNYISASEKLEAVLSEKSDSRLNITAVGHSHLDLAWLWPIRETRRKAARTLSNALYNMDHYDKYIYGASQPQEFLWLSKDYPIIYDRIKEAYRKGRFEPQGGMWVECDTNIPSGEALIRQFYYGKKFWKEEFGEDVKNCWLPDVFGYSAALPQIMKKCGVDYFMTQKLSWNEHNEFPLETFFWEGLSSDRVLTHLLPGNNYNSSGAAPSLRELELNHRRKDITDEALVLFGAGDGGGGPCQANIELIERFSDMKGTPKVSFGKAFEFFENLSRKNYSLPVFKGELYLEKHQGTYTTQSDTKKNNHLCEKELHNMEMLGAAALIKGIPYDSKKAEEIWREVLLYQFHDILPGSAIHRVYKECGESYKRLLEAIRKAEKEAEEKLPHSKKITGINFDSFERKGYIKHSGEWYSYNLMPYSAGNIYPVTESFSEMKTDGIIMESDMFRLVFSEYGDITSLKDKNSGKEYVSSSLNSLNLYKDKKLFYNAWDIDIDYVKQTPLKLHRTSFRAYTDGPDAVTENYYSTGSSEIIQRVILRKNLPYVMFETFVSWHETHRMLRADFRPSVYSDKVKCDIQFGNIERSTTERDKKEWAQFEICAHKYVDVSDDSYGTAVLSDGKYGFRVKNGLISLNLLRSPVYPDKTADRGCHSIRYAFCPHKGGCFDARVPELSYCFNRDIRVSNIKFPSMLSVSCRNVICETLMPSPDNKGITVRLYENEGREVKATVKAGFEYKELYETDMLGNILKPSEKTLDFSPYEIKTLLFAL